MSDVYLPEKSVLFVVRVNLPPVKKSPFEKIMTTTPPTLEESPLQKFLKYLWAQSFPLCRRVPVADEFQGTVDLVEPGDGGGVSN